MWFSSHQRLIATDEDVVFSQGNEYGICEICNQIPESEFFNRIIYLICISIIDVLALEN